MLTLFFLIIFFILFLFVFYVFAREDHIFYRRNVTLEMVFDISFIGFVVVVLVSRLWYVVLNPALAYLNPLVLLIFPYFPGLSLAGGILGGVFYCIYMSHRKKIPTGRLLDIVCLSFLLTLSLGIEISEIVDFIMKKHGFLFPMLAGVIFFISFIIFTVTFVKNKWKDGKVSLIILLTVSIVSIAENILLNLTMHKNIFFVKENYLFVLIIFLAVVLLATDRRRGRG